MKKYKKGFTLAETLIALTVLGIIAAITVPNLIRKQAEAQNRTRLKKAMTVFDMAIAKMTVENDLKTMNALKSWADEGGTCNNSRVYFKTLANTGDGACKFKTSDGIWWDITEIDKPIVAFKEANLTSEKAKAEDDYDAFTLVASFDESNGAFRVDDNGFEQKYGTADKKACMIKLWNYIRNKKAEESTIEKVINQYCNCNGDNCCSTSCPNEVCIQKDVECTNEISNYGCVSEDHMTNLSCNFEKTDNCTAYKITNGNTSWKIAVSDDVIYATMGNNENGVRKCAKLQNGNVYCQKNTVGWGGAINGIEYDNNGEPIAYYNYDRDVCTKTNCPWNNNPFNYNISYLAEVNTKNTSDVEYQDIFLYNLVKEQLINSK